MWAAIGLALPGLRPSKEDDGSLSNRQIGRRDLAEIPGS
jgi:hypothetical protein